jgi:hypothetical protein
MPWEKPSKAERTFEAGLTNSLKKITKIHNSCFQSDSGRYAYYRYLLEIYSLEEKYKKKRGSLKAALEDLVDTSVRKNSKITNLLIYATSNKPLQMKSKWGIALRNSRRAGVTESDLVAFIKEQGGPMKFGIVIDQDNLKRRYKKFKAKTAADQED